jgi:hypothetical protein
MTDDEAAARRMARAAYENACSRHEEHVRRGLKPWERLEEQVRVNLTDDQRAALLALCAGPLPRAVLRRAIEELLAQENATAKANGVRTTTFGYCLRNKLAELYREENGG